MTDWFGDLYRLSTAPLLGARTTMAEAAFLAAALRLAPGLRTLDCGAGWGRHAAALARNGLGPIVALDRSLAYLRDAPLPGLCADLAALPVRARAFDAAYAWYNSLFDGSDEKNAAVLAEVARALRSGARLVLHGTNPAWAAARPTAREEATLPGGARAIDESRWDARTGRDHIRRRLILPDGRVLEGEIAIRYYPPPDLARMANAAGLVVERFHGGPNGSPLSDESVDLIAVLVRGR